MRKINEHSDAHQPDGPAATPAFHGERPTILVVSRRPDLEPDFARAALGVAERTRGELLVLSVDTMPQADDETPARPGAPRPLFASRAKGAAEALAAQAAARGLALRHTLGSGPVDKAVNDCLRAAPAVDFILLDADIPASRIRAVSAVPVFSLTTSKVNKEGELPDAAAFNWNGPENVDHQGEQIMSQRTRRPVGKTIAFGLAAVGLYATLYAYSDQIAEIYGRGGLYALLPVASVFLFSYVHGNFTGSFWSMLGIEASSKKQKKTVQPTQPARQDRRPRATIQA